MNGKGVVEEGGTDGGAGLKEPLRDSDFLERSPTLITTAIHKSVTTGGVGEQVQGHAQRNGSHQFSPRRCLCAREKPYALQPAIHKSVATGEVGEQVQGYAAWRLSATVHISSAQDGIYAFGKSYMRSSPSLRSFPNVAQRVAGIAQWLERRTRDRKVVGSNPCRSGGRMFFSRVNFLC